MPISIVGIHSNFIINFLPNMIRLQGPNANLLQIQSNYFEIESSQSSKTLNMRDNPAHNRIASTQPWPPKGDWWIFLGVVGFDTVF